MLPLHHTPHPYTEAPGTEHCVCDLWRTHHTHLGVSSAACTCMGCVMARGECDRQGTFLCRAAAPEGQCTAATGPIWKLDGEICGCRLPAKHVTDDDPAARWHECSCNAQWVDPTPQPPAPHPPHGPQSDGDGL